MLMYNTVYILLCIDKLVQKFKSANPREKNTEMSL